MRVAQASPILLGILAGLVSANPFPRDSLKDFGFGWLMVRGCSSYCGSDNQFCCQGNEQCITTTGRATCTAGGAGGGVALFTTTWTETRTYTSTWSTYFPGATTPASGGTGGQPCKPPEGSGQIACGPICCANWQYCSDNVKGQCMPNAGAGTWSYGTTVGVVTTEFQQPYRVTGGSTVMQTAGSVTATATTTNTGDAAGASNTGATQPGTTSGGGLSPGAIAGIVVGVIAGVILLLLFCVCCIIRGLWHTVMSILGFGKKKERKERIEVTEERYSRHGSVHGGRREHRGWFGGGGGRPSTVASRKEKKSSSGIGWLAAAGGAALLLLGLRRGDKKKANKPPRSDYGSTYYSGSYTASSPSSASSDRRTRDTRRSRHSRGTRASRHTRRS